MFEKSHTERIAHEVIRTLYLRFNSFPEDLSHIRNAPFHEAFLNAFKNRLSGKVTDIKHLISLSSWLHGLNTTLGQSFFENVSRILSSGEKKSFTNARGNQLFVTEEQKKVISDIITDLKNSSREPDLERESSLITKYEESPRKIPANDFTVDVFIEDEHQINCIELKSVKPNAGEIRGEKQKILEAKAALIHEYKDKSISYYLGFPFDPTSDTPTGFDKRRFLNSIVDGQKYVEIDEFLLAKELWDFLSENENTMEKILEIINTIATPNFIKHLNYINEIKNRDDEGYVKTLKKWFLYSEVNIQKDREKIIDKLETNKDRRIYNQQIFKITLDKFEFNQSRLFYLQKFL